MRDSQNLLLLTNRYPFSPGEEYIHTEIPYLAKTFNKVYILPLMRTPGSTHVRDLPGNVSVLGLAVRHDWATRIRLARTGITTPTPPSNARGIKQKLYDRYFHARTVELARLAEPLIRDVLLSENIDIVYSYWFYITTSVAIELRSSVGELQSAPIIARGHGYDVNEAASPAKYLPLRERMLQEVSRLHPTADTITTRMQQEWPAYADKISTRRLGVELPSATTSRSNAGVLKVLSCSSLSPIKRIHLIAEGLATLRARGIEANWTHLGSGTPKQESALRSTISRLGLADYVDLRGQVTNGEVYETLQSGEHTVFVNTSSSESVSFSMAEAMGAGLPVVGTDVVGTHEILHDKQNGRLLVANPSADEIADALNWIASLDENAYAALTARSAEVCARMFDPDTVYSQFSRELATTQQHEAKH